MTDLTPDDRTAGETSEARTGALAVWILYALIFPSGGLTAFIGVVVAYVMRDKAGGLYREHFDSQIRLFWSGLIWAILFSIAWAVSFILSFLLIGIPFLVLFCIALFLLGVWFTVKGVLGALALTSDRAP